MKIAQLQSKQKPKQMFVGIDVPANNITIQERVVAWVITAQIKAESYSMIL